MQTLNPRIDLDAIFEHIPAAPARVLMLDYDGTLAPFQVRPERAVPYPGVTGVLEDLIRQGDTRVVIVSGRRAADLVPLLALRQLPEIWGGHGWERLLPNGELLAEEPPHALRQELDRAADAMREAVRSGARLERKPASLALHWRGLPALAVAKIQERALAAWSLLTRDGALHLLPFDGGIELRAQECNKQHAVKAVLSETAADSAIAYLGDDLTDEDAFTAVKARGLAVLVRPQLRETTQADLWLRPPRELIAFLKRWRASSVVRA